MLQEAGFSLPWIEELKAIEADIETMRQALRQAWDWRQQAQAEDQPARFIHLEWDRAVNTFRNRLAALNQRIRDVNLEVPNPRFQRPLLKFENEFKKIIGEI
jgi:septal ring factor EnvC (AmiA/AmiB activator)